MRIVLDTNVLVSALHFGGRPRRVLERAIRGEYELVTGAAILRELERILIDTCGWDSARAAMARSEVEGLAHVAHQATIPRVCRDPDDDAILSIAVAGHAEAIVTGDSDLLDLDRYGAVAIMTVTDFEERASSA